LYSRTPFGPKNTQVLETNHSLLPITKLPQCTLPLTTRIRQPHRWYRLTEHQNSPIKLLKVTYDYVMPQRSEQAEIWFATVCTAVQEIPHGKVTSYGHIAMLVGKRTEPPLLSPTTAANFITAECPRQVGVCMKHLPTDTALRFNSTTVPWQRLSHLPVPILSSDSRRNSGNKFQRMHQSTVRKFLMAIRYRRLTKVRGPTGATNQAAALRREGVRVVRGAMGEYMVDLSVNGW
jgi:methylated-DNA-protein-cysteine methyltransferase-like protein